MRICKIALIGVGGRGEGLYRVALRMRKNVEFAAVCDIRQEKCEYIAKEMAEDGRSRPAVFADYRECLEKTKPDAIVVATSWVMHTEICMYAMERGIPVAVEVGGSYSIQSMWELVRCYERTKTPIMMLENCCYGRIELLALNMKRQGLLGTVVHCEGGYRHYLTESFFKGGEPFRFEEYRHRNSEDYPTHEIGPIAKLLDINCGNRFVSLMSMGSAAVGMSDYAKTHGIQEYDGTLFRKSDIITTLIKCQNGETVTITLDTILPRYYSRSFLAQGTKGLICEENQSVYLASDNPEEEFDWSGKFNNIRRYYKKYDHPLWRGYRPGKAGHGGMDMLVFNAFFEALESGSPMPVDVYDMVTWRAIGVLSEVSMETGNTVAFPDFTDGKWISRKNTFAL